MPVDLSMTDRWTLEDRGHVTPCWIWRGAKTKGYGVTSHDGNSHAYVHRVLYMEHNGPIPDGLELDHLCRVPACVNPDHLEAVTHRENILRSDAPMARQAKQTHCIHGHPLFGANLYLTPGGKRHCKTCTNQRGSAARAKLKAEHARYRDALERIAATEPGILTIDGQPQPWTHWREIAREALANVSLG